MDDNSASAKAARNRKAEKGIWTNDDSVTAKVLRNRAAEKGIKAYPRKNVKNKEINTLEKIEDIKTQKDIENAIIYNYEHFPDKTYFNEKTKPSDVTFRIIYFNNLKLKDMNEIYDNLILNKENYNLIYYEDLNKKAQNRFGGFTEKEKWPHHLSNINDLNFDLTCLTESKIEKEKYILIYSTNNRPSNMVSLIKEYSNEWEIYKKDLRKANKELEKLIGKKQFNESFKKLLKENYLTIARGKWIHNLLKKEIWEGKLKDYQINQELKIKIKKSRSVNTATSKAARNRIAEKKNLTRRQQGFIKVSYTKPKENNSIQKVQKRDISLSKRTDVLERDNYTCQICGRTHEDGVKLEVDHKIPVSKGGSNDMNNLQTLCFECNRGKSNKILKNQF